MAVVNTKSLAVSSKDSTPNLLDYRREHIAIDGGQVAVAAADDDTSVYRVLRVKSSQRYYGGRLVTTAITGGTDYDFGLYRTQQDGGAVVDADALVDGQTMASAISTPTELVLVAANAFWGKRYWEIAGLTADPGVDYDLCWTANTVGTAAGTITTYVSSSAI
jgi:hypothetical protein